MKRIAIAVVSVVALLAIFVAAAPYVVPESFLRSLVATQITAWTGRTVTVAGEPHLAVYPDLAITVDQVTVSNPDGTTDEAFVTADVVRASMRILPLLIGRAEFDEIELIRPRFRLVVAEDGNTNWRIAAGAIAEQVARATRGMDEAPESNGGTTSSADMRIGRLTVTDGIVLYDDLASDHREEMADLDLTVEWPSALAAARGSGALTWRGERVAFNGSVTDPVALIAGDGSSIRFAIAATMLRVSFAGEARANGQLQLDGRASATTPSLRRAIAWTGAPIAPGAVLGTASIEGAARWVGNAISFETATVELDGNRGEGSVSFVATEPRLAVHGDLTTARLDLSPYAEASRADIVAEGSWLLAPTGLDFAEIIDVDVRIAAGQVLIGATRFANLTAGVTVRDGAIGVDVTQGQFYGGNLIASAGAGMVGDELVAGAEISLADVPARVALTDLAGIDAIDGTAAATVSIRSRGATWGEFARALAGNGAISVRRGTLAGIDLIAVAETMADPLAEPMDTFGGSTAFSNLAATLAIGDGGLAAEDLTMKGAGFDLSLSGKGSLINGLIEGNAELALESDTIPLRITGRWRAPIVARVATPDAPPGVAGDQAVTHEESGSATGG